MCVHSLISPLRNNDTASAKVTVLTEDVIKIRKKHAQEAEEAMAGGLSKANIFMSF